MSTGRADLEQSVAREGWRESVRRASECALLGVLCFVCSIPLVTVGAAWAAVADICHSWSRDEEPPLVPTFLRAVRREFVPGLALSALLLVVVALPYLEIRIVAAAHLPGAWVESIGLGVVAAGCLGVLLLAFPTHAEERSSWAAAVRTAAQLAVRGPWVALVALTAVGVGAVLVDVFPPLVVLIGGPIGYAVSAVHAWGRAVIARRSVAPGT